MGSRWRFTGAVALWMTVMHAGAYGAAAAQMPSGTWAPAASMAEARSGASAALLQDGSFLIAGGAKDGEPLASVEIFNRGSFSATGSMLLARRSAAAVTLKDGRVLVAGGSTSSGPTSETELYNPVTRSWTIGDSMLASRSGHTATLLADGRVLIAGGEGSGAPGATLEIFNPDTGSFSAAGTLTTPRKNHAAVLLSGGRVMIVGGFDGSHILNSTEIFDPATAKVSSGPSLSIARMGHSATTLLNGDLLVAGGSDGSQDLASAELYSASGTSASASSGRTDGFTSAANMLSARSSHSAFLLPHNAAVLMAGGSSASAELYQAWNSAFIPTGSPANSRSGAAGTPLAADGLLLLAGGTTSTAELYGFPTIKTDKDDYSPGVRAIITGGRWAAGEAVTLVFVEVPKRHPDQFLQLTADASGDLYYDQWAPERHDVGVRFYVTAAGSRSGSQAQMTFTDGDKTWNGNVSTVWTNTSNWTGGVVPGASDKAIIPAGRPFYPVISGAKQSVGSIQIDSGASLTVSSDLVLSKSTSTADSVVISGTLDWTSGAITFASTSVSLTVNSGGVFKLRNTTLGMPAFPAISLNANSTVEYGGANQTIKVDSVLTTYGHLKTSGTGVKTWSTGTAAIINGNLDVGAASTLTLGGHITVNGNLSIGSGTTLGVGSNRNITLMGNWTNNGTFAQGGSGATVTLNSSTAQQTIGGTTATTFINLTISNASGYGIRLSQNATVNAGLGLSTGIIDAATDNTTLKVAWSGSCCTNTSSSYVIGKFARDYSGAGSKKFPVGKGGNYRPATIYFTTLTGVSTTAPATITVEQFESNIPGGTAPNTSLLGSRYWHVTQVGGSSGFVYNITLDGTGTSPAKPVKILRASGGTPVVFPVTGTAPNYVASSLTASGGDFALAQDANPTSLAVTSATGTYGATINLSATLTSNGSPVSGKTISFTLNGNIVGTATTTSGVATVNSVSLAATNAGTYSTGVGASFAGDATYEATSALNFLTVNKAAATIALGDLSQTYDGTPKPPTATTSPAGLGEINFTYNSSSTTPTNAGSYSFVASLNNVNYTASNVSGTLVIGKAAATIALGALAQTYDGSPKSATATPSPAGLSGVSVTYEGSPDAPINASSYAVEASLSNDNYQASNVGGTLVIGKASATIALSNLSQAYNGSPKQATAATNPSGLPGVTITYDGSETALSSVGTYAVVASLINTNYAASDATGNLVIAKGTATITLGGLTHTYDGLAKSATASSPDGDVIITYDESPTPPTNAGSYAVLASVNNGNYLASVSGTLVISKAAATITLGGLTHTYDGSAKSATVTTSPEGLSGVTIKYDGSTTAPTQAGSYSVVATLDNTNYDGSTTGTLMISKAATSITMSNLAQTYDGSAKSATATTNPELSGVTITYNGLTTAINAGSYAVVASLTNPNYEAPNATATMVIAKATTTITLSNLAQTYNGSPKTATATTNPAGLSGVSITYNGSAAAPSDAASYAVVASLNNANYEPASASDTLVIGKATATIILSNLSQTYDGASKHATAPTTPAGLSGVSITYDGLATEPINAGSYHVVASLNNENYNPVSASGTLVIGKATATMTLNGLAPTYDGSPKPVTATTSPADLTVISITYDGSTAAPTGAGSYVVVASLSNDNYQGSVSGSLIIGKATATITLSDLAHTYDDLPKSATATTSPADLTVVTITYNGSPTVPVNAGSYAVAASLSNDNYQGSASGTLVISKAAAIITLDGLAHIYDGSTKPATATTSPADLTVVTITYNGSATTPTNAGSYAVVASLANSNYEASNAIGTLVIDKASASITLGNSNLTFTYDGSAKSATAATVPGGLSFSITYNGSTTAPIGAGNYTVVASVTNPNYAASDAAGTLDISKALAVITLGNLTQTYDGPAKPASATTSPSGLNGVSITYDGLASAPADAGSYAVVASLTNANYTASDATGTLTINKATATIALSNLTQTYNGSPKSPTATTTPAGLIVSITYNGSATVPSGAGSYAVVAALTNANYAASNATGTLVINKAAATIALSNLTQGYDGLPKPATATTSPEGLSGVSITYNGSATAPTNLGSYAVVASLANPNYVASNATGTLVISKGTAAITLSNLTQTYDGSPNPVTATTSPEGLSGVSITYNGSATAPTSVGSYAVVASLANPNYVAPTATGTLVIMKVNQTITFAQPADISKALTTFTLSATATSGLAVTYTSLTTTVCTVSGSKVSLKLGGYCTIRASQAGTANYNPAPIVDRNFLIWNPTANVSGTGTFTSTSPAGTANFTVSAKYLTGATVPSGTTTFSVGTLSFSSTSYERLYGSGTTGLYWGTGTLNGVAGYSFRVTAVDGGRSTDRFRIKIWHDVSGVTVIDYDNQPGTPDDATLTVSSTLLTGGSLTIKN